MIIVYVERKVGRKEGRREGKGGGKGGGKEGERKEEDNKEPLEKSSLSIVWLKTVHWQDITNSPLKPQ